MDGEKFGSIEAGLATARGATTWLTISLREGKNRDMRRAVEHLGYPGSRLIRVAYGPFQLGKLPKNAVEDFF